MLEEKQAWDQKLQMLFSTHGFDMKSSKPEDRK